MFEYFPGIYPWNLAMGLALNMGGLMSEIDSVCRPLRKYQAALEPGAGEDWISAWLTLGERVAAYSRRDRNAGHRKTAGKNLRRASLYYLLAERMMHSGDPKRPETYRTALDCFREAIQLAGDPVEFVEIPYRDRSLPALFVRAEGSGPRPCMIHLDGFDVMKELIYFRSVAEVLAPRGISTLIVDHPGVGEALRLRGMSGIVETERYVGASIDYLERRTDVDTKRIGVIGVSLGGYFAPRAAAFEKRLACCVAWGACYSFPNRIQAMVSGQIKAPSVADQLMHGQWVFGAETPNELVDKTRGMSLQGIVEKITCPLLVVHGENDRQVPLEDARMTYDQAINCAKRELRVFTAEEGGDAHVQIDNPLLAIDFMSDWIETVLVGRQS